MTQWIILGVFVIIVLLLRMIKFFVRLVLVVLVLIGFFIWQAKAQDLSVEVASDHIDITVGFNGSSIEVFGDRRDKKTDVAIFVTGPEKAITVWSKAQVFGAWVNRHFAHFKRQPAYYAYATSFDETDAEGYGAVMKANRIGLSGLFENSDIRLSSARQDRQKFIDALIDYKQSKGIYAKEGAKIKFMNPNFFRVSFDIPAASPTGEYKIHSFLIQKGQIIETDIDTLKVEQVGVNAFFLGVAKNSALFYALFCIILGVFSGWLVNVVRLRV